MGYNTVISSLMILANNFDNLDTITSKDYNLLLTLLYPIAPHISEELNEDIGYSPICEGEWPTYSEEKTIEEEKEIGVQVNGKLRGSIKVNVNDNEEDYKKKALENSNVAKFIQNKEIVKIIVIKNKIVNIVIK